MSNKNKTIDEIQNQNNQSMLKFWQGTEDEFGQSVTQNWYNWKYSSGGSSEPSEWIKTYLIDETTHDKIYCKTESIAYGNGKFVIVGSIGNTKKHKILTSDDGINWTVVVEFDSSIDEPKSVICYNGSIFTIFTNTAKSFYSMDGINWNENTLDISIEPLDIAYGNGKFIVALDTTTGIPKYAYSEDGINWEFKDSPNATSKRRISYKTITFADNKFVMLGRYRTTGYSVYSEDGINWTVNTLTSTSGSYHGLTYAKDKFIAFNSNNKLIYSEDGITWNEDISVPASKSDYWNLCAYGNEIFIAFSSKSTLNESNYIYSKDGITWNEIALSKGGYTFTDMIYAQNKFIVVGTLHYIFVMNAPDSQESLIYTKEETPTIESKVYSEPNVESTLAITSTTNSSITLSDTNTYDRNANGDKQTSGGSIGDEHPDYLCFINGVGIKIGNKLIIKNNKKIDVNPEPPVPDTPSEETSKEFTITSNADNATILVNEVQ